MSETAKAARGIKWNYAGTAVQIVAQLAFVAVAARLLDPAAFGLMAIAGVLVRFGSYLSGAGIRSYLIQKKTLTDADVESAFLLTSVLAVVLCLGAFHLAPHAAGWVDTPAAAPVIQALSLSFVASGLAVTPSALLQRALRFRALTIIETASYVVGYLGIGLSLAVSGAGVWALVGAALSQQTLVLALSFAAAPHPAGFRIRAAQLAEAALKGGHFAANTVLDYCVNAAPTLIVGRGFDAADLGVFNRAANLINLPTYAVSSAASRVVLPFISPYQSDRARLGRVHARWASISTLVVLPLCLGMIPAAPEIVALALGDRWEAAIPVVRVLAVATAAHVLALQLGTCADAVRALRARTAISAVTLLVMAAAMLGLMHHGLVGAAAGVAVAQVVRLAIYLCLLDRWFALSPRDLIAAYAPGAVAGLLTAAAVGAAGRAAAGSHPAVVLAAEVLAGAAALATVARFYPSASFQANLRAALRHLGLAGRLPLTGFALRSGELR